MTKRRNARLYRAYMAIVGAAAAVAVVGGIFAVWATENTAAAPTVAPTNVGEPSISGTARVGQVLRTTRGTWTGTGPITYSYPLVPLRRDEARRTRPTVVGSRMRRTTRTS